MESIRKPWHLLHLIKGEENAENIDCPRCRKSVLGIPTYRCSDCNFRVHESCGAEPDGEMEIGHNLREIHHVISRQLGTDGKEEAVCSLCEKTVPKSSGKNVSIIYKCIIPECKFLTHESCIELPVTIVGYSHDPHHTLSLKPPTGYRWGPCCSSCEKEIPGGSFFYSCNECPYEIHTTCSTPWKNKARDCSHEYIAIWKRKPIEFTCDVCGKKNSDRGLDCSKCRLLIHTDCVRFICDIGQTGHEHDLTFTLSLSQDKHNECQACGGKVNTNYGAYRCKEGCEHVLHVFCGYAIQQQGGKNDVHGCPPYLVGWIGDGKEWKAVDMKIHPSHPEHELSLKNEDPNDKVCQGCEESIVIPPFYSCEECKFCLHIRCALLPAQVARPAYDYDPLSLHNAPSDVEKSSFHCWECERFRSVFSFRLRQGRPLDVQCALIPDGTMHPLHEHQLFRDGFGGGICNACGIYSSIVRTFDCKTCDFKVCIKYLALPLKAKHKYDKDLPSLVNTLECDADKNYCQICEEKINQKFWFYHCKEHDFSSHPSCILGKKT